MDLASRAHVHAALGDTTRLKVVDLLTFGDLTVNELRTGTGVSSNLLAHHLDTLEDVGIIERRVSEGDRRRRYVVLRRDVIAHADVTGASRPHAPLFVCTHNSARSQFAAAWWRNRTGELTDSAGTAPAATVHPTAVSVAADLGVDLGSAVPHGYESVTLQPDVVISVCDRAGEGALPFPAPHAHWSVPDPVAIGSRAAFEAAFTEIAARIDAAIAEGTE
jgi:ArsR family transcriptional regulator, arsenate/arsenite/antimonite-responsive transcriptional repressor / arsenate reductase (thioredoxin)